MDDTIERIKSNVLILDSTIPDDDLLDFVIGDVVDRALIYTNRAQLVQSYEEDLEDSTVESSEYVYPIPLELERPLALTVYKAYKNVKNDTVTQEQTVKSISDNGQSITFGDSLMNYLHSGNDQDVFSGITKLLDKFILPTIVENTNYINYPNKKTFLR